MKFKSLFLTASAGAGKTTRLAKEVLEKIQDDDRSVIAITFTRQAKAEMEQRILSTIFYGDFPSEEKMALIMKAGKVHFSTIDALFHYLLSTECYLPEVADTDEQAKIEQLAAEIFLKKISSWDNEELILIASRILHIQPEKLAEELSRTRNVLLEWMCSPETVIKLRRKQEILKNYLKKIQHEIDKICPKRSGNFYKIVFYPLLRKLEELPGRYRILRVNNIDEVGKIALQDRKSEVYDRMKEIQSKFRCVYAGYILNTQQLRAALLKQLCEAYSQALEEVKDRWGKIFFEDIVTKLISLDGKESIEKPVLMAKLYEIGIHSATDLLIDEFQDTSSTQLELLVPLMEEILSEVNENAEGYKSLFFVGDWKQSIYQWRDARPNELKDWISSYIKKGQIKEENLPFNWRSTPLLISFFNNLSIRLFGSSVVQQIPPFEQRKKPYSGISEVSVIPVSDKKDEMVVYEKLVDEVERIKRVHDCEWGDIAVLCRTNTKVNTVKKVLMERGILTTGVRGREILDLREGVALYLSLAAIFMPDSRCSSYIDCALSGLGYGALKPIIENLAFKYSHIHPPHRLSDLTEVLVDLEPHFPRPIFESVWNWASSYFNRSDSEDVASFLAEWFCLSEYVTVPEAEHSDRVRVSTMHAVKGLEFPHVVVLWLLDPDRTEVFSHPQKGYPLTLNKVELDFLRTNPIKGGEIIAKTYEKIQESRKEETLNLLYVSVTRAIQSVSVIMKEKKDYNIVETALIDAIAQPIEAAHRTEYGWYVNYGTKEQKEEEEDIPLQFSAREASQRDIEADKPDIIYLSSEIEDRIERGQRIHGALATLKEDGEEIDFSGLMDEEREILHRFLRRDDVRGIVFRRGKVYTEQHISNSREFGIVDRLIIGNNLITLIDYKTGKKDPNLIQNYRLQMEHYLSILSSIFKDFPIEAYLLFVDDDEPVEQVR